MLRPSPSLPDAARLEGAIGGASSFVVITRCAVPSNHVAPADPDNRSQARRAAVAHGSVGHQPARAGPPTDRRLSCGPGGLARSPYAAGHCNVRMRRSEGERPGRPGRLAKRRSARESRSDSCIALSCESRGAVAGATGPRAADHHLHGDHRD